MANISAYFAKQMLDWSLKGAGAGAATQPASLLIALASGTPSSVGFLGGAVGSEILPNSGYTRQSALFTAAASPAGSASNSGAVTFGPFSSIGTIQGIVIYDTSAFTAGNMLWYGTLLTARTILANDTLVIAQGALIATLS